MTDHKMEITLTDVREDLLSSVLRDTYTGAMLMLCIWTSRGSTAWTFITVLLAIAFLTARAAIYLHRARNIFGSLEELEAWTAEQRQRQPEATQ